MCLRTLKNPKYIKKLPKEFTAYKVVRERKGKFYPLCFCTGKPFKHKNTSPRRAKIHSFNGSFAYIPYFHCWKTLKGARRWKGPWNTNRIIKITIKRKDVTALGLQNGCLVIVTKKFTTDFKIVK